MAVEKIDRYELHAELAQTEMSVVYRAYDPRFRREVALKVLPSELLHNPQFRKRFEREALAIAALEHPAIVPVYDYGEDERRPYLSMRLMRGGSLAARLTAGPMPLEACGRIITRLASALDYAHANGVLHRDLKPGNILFDSENRPYLTDFSLAKLMYGEHTVLTVAGDFVGTPAYISPEMARGDKELDHRSDIYSLGVVVYEMLSGSVPFTGDTPWRVALLHVKEPPPDILTLRVALPPETRTVMERALAKDPADRYQSASALAEAVTALSKERAPAAFVPPDSSATRADPTPEAHPLSPPTRLDPPSALPADPPTEKPPRQPGAAASERKIKLSSRILTVLLLLLIVGLCLAGAAAALYSQQERVFVELTRLPELLAGGLTGLATPTPTPTLAASTSTSLPEIGPTAGPTATRTPDAVSMTPPLVGIISPPPGALLPLGDEVNIVADITHVDGLAEVSLTVNGETVARIPFGGEKQIQLEAPVTLTLFGESAISLAATSLSGVTSEPVTLAVTTRLEDITRPEDNMEMLFVPAGRFTMGSPPDDPAAEADEQPEHEVLLDAFWMDRKEVTSAQYAAFLSIYGNSSAGGSAWLDVADDDANIGETEGNFSPAEGLEDHPVVEVSWYGAAAYCGWFDGRLPTEAEWEYAARGQAGVRFPWGDGDPTCEQANYLDCQAGAAPAGSYPAAAGWLGHLDLSGNVWEWVFDWYDGAFYADSREANPSGPANGDLKTARGGAWDEEPLQLRGVNRYGGADPTTTENNLGFRCVLPYRP